MLGLTSNQLNQDLWGLSPAPMDCKTSPGDFNVLIRITVLGPNSDPSGLGSAYLIFLLWIPSLLYQLFCSLENMSRTHVPRQNGGRDEIHWKISLSILSVQDLFSCWLLRPSGPPASLASLQLWHPLSPAPLLPAHQFPVCSIFSSQPHQWLASLAWTEDPLQELQRAVPADRRHGLLFRAPPLLAFCPREVNPWTLGIEEIQIFHFQNTDWWTLWGWCDKVPTSFQQAGRKAVDCFPNGSKKGLAVAHCPRIIENWLSCSLWNLNQQTQVRLGQPPAPSPEQDTARASALFIHWGPPTWQVLCYLLSVHWSRRQIMSLEPVNLTM